MHITATTAARGEGMKPPAAATGIAGGASGWRAFAAIGLIWAATAGRQRPAAGAALEAVALALDAGGAALGAVAAAARPAAFVVLGGGHLR